MSALPPLPLATYYLVRRQENLLTPLLSRLAEISIYQATHYFKARLWYPLMFHMKHCMKSKQNALWDKGVLETGDGDYGWVLVGIFAAP